MYELLLFKENISHPKVAILILQLKSQTSLYSNHIKDSKSQSLHSYHRTHEHLISRFPVRKNLGHDLQEDIVFDILTGNNQIIIQQITSQQTTITVPASVIHGISLVRMNNTLPQEIKIWEEDEKNSHREKIIEDSNSSHKKTVLDRGAFFNIKPEIQNINGSSHWKLNEHEAFQEPGLDGPH